MNHFVILRCCALTPAGSSAPHSRSLARGPAVGWGRELAG